MRISTSSLYDRSGARMRAMSQEAARIDASISTGKRFAAASEDPVAFRAVTGLRRAAADGAQDAANLRTADATLAASDTALGAVERALQRVQEIAILSKNGTVSAQQRALYAAELDTAVEDLTRLANATDAAGAPLFAGSGTAPPYTVDAAGKVAYGGSGKPAAIPIGDGASVVAGVAGDAVFAFAGAGGPTDMFATIAALSEALKAGGTDDNALADVKTALDTVGVARASLGARAARVEIEQTRIVDAQLARETERAGHEDTDPYAAMTQLQKTLTVLEATQASFGKLTQLSLFDYLR